MRAILILALLFTCTRDRVVLTDEEVVQFNCDGMEGDALVACVNFFDKRNKR